MEVFCYCSFMYFKAFYFVKQKMKSLSMKILLTGLKHVKDIYIKFYVKKWIVFKRLHTLDNFMSRQKLRFFNLNYFEWKKSKNHRLKILLKLDNKINRQFASHNVCYINQCSKCNSSLCSLSVMLDYTQPELFLLFIPDQVINLILQNIFFFCGIIYYLKNVHMAY